MATKEVERGSEVGYITDSDLAEVRSRYSSQLTLPCHSQSGIRPQPMSQDPDRLLVNKPWNVPRFSPPCDLSYTRRHPTLWLDAKRTIPVAVQGP